MAVLVPEEDEEREKHVKVEGESLKSENSSWEDGQ